MNVDANFAVRSGTTDKFTVASSTGNINTSGNLTVNGNTDLGNASTDTITMTAHVDSDIVPSGTTRDLGGASAKWRDGYFTGTLYATGISGVSTFSGNLTGNVTSTGTSSFNNITVSGLMTGSISGNAGTATQLATARNIGGVSFNGTANIDLPGVNTAGNQNTSGNAATATQVYVTETSANLNYPLVFTDSTVTANSGNMGLQKDAESLFFAPSSNTLTVVNIAAVTFGNSGQNAFGARFISTQDPTGGVDGDIWYKI